jgi:molecular chaperone GrpE
MRDSDLMETPPTISDDLAACEDRLLRLAADFDNYRKRSQHERVTVVKSAREALLRDFLPIVDNLERALEHMGPDISQFAEGIDLVLNQFLDTLAQHGVRPFDSVGEPFDPRRHEAVGQVQSDQVPAGYVVQELRRGYTLNEDLVRATKVIVSGANQ